MSKMKRLFPVILIAVMLCLVGCAGQKLDKEEFVAAVTNSYEAFSAEDPSFTMDLSLKTATGGVTVDISTHMAVDGDKIYYNVTGGEDITEVYVGKVDGVVYTYLKVDGEWTRIAGNTSGIDLGEMLDDFDFVDAEGYDDMEYKKGKFYLKQEIFKEAYGEDVEGECYIMFKKDKIAEMYFNIKETTLGVTTTMEAKLTITYSADITLPTVSESE